MQHLKPSLLMIALASTLAAGPNVATAADGNLDPAYGSNGRTSIGYLESHTVVMRGYDRSPVNGTTWMVGDDRHDPAAIYISRLLPDGQPDPGFGPNSNGRRRITLPTTLIPQIKAIDIAGAWVQADGKPVVFGGLRPVGNDTGAFPAVVCRLAAAGNLDASFGEAGCRTIRTFQSNDEICRVSDVAATYDNHGILVIGHCQASSDAAYPFIGRLTSSGTIDLDFGAGLGIVVPPSFIDVVEQRFRSLAVRPDGLAVVAGDVLQVEPNSVAHRNMAASQFDGGGSLDTKFGSAGITRIAFDLGESNDDEGRDVALRPDGTAVILGQSVLPSINRRLALLAQLTPAGVLDTAFDDGGRMVDELDAGFGGDSTFNALALDDQGRSFIDGARVEGMPASVQHLGAGIERALATVSQQFRTRDPHQLGIQFVLSRHRRCRNRSGQSGLLHAAIIRASQVPKGHGETRTAITNPVTLAPIPLHQEIHEPARPRRPLQGCCPAVPAE